MSVSAGFVNQPLFVSLISSVVMSDPMADRYRQHSILLVMITYGKSVTMI